LRLLEEEDFQLDSYRFIDSSENITYNLHYGNNLISYIGSESFSNIDDILPDDVQDLFIDIIGENSSATRIDGEWVGSLANNGLQPLRGYWVNVNEELDFINEEGHTVDSEGRLTNEEGRYIAYRTKEAKEKKDQSKVYFVNRDGEEVICKTNEKGEEDWVKLSLAERKPFLDDSGKPLGKASEKPVKAVKKTKRSTKKAEEAT